MAIDLSKIQLCVANRLDPAGKRLLAAVIGDTPSHYSKSPPLWNAVFDRLAIDAVYLPFDVEAGRLKELLSALRNCADFLGCNVTVPHKRQVIEYLDALDPQASRIQAVNTIVRSADGRLVGANTDGGGFIESLRSVCPGEKNPFVESFKGLRVLILGAGGSARAVAFALAGVIESGEIVICNRTAAAGAALAEELRVATSIVRAVGEEDLAANAGAMNLIVNCSVKGQGGVRRDEDGGAMLLQFYSALAPARPKSFPAAQASHANFTALFEAACRADIDANNDASMAIATAVPKECGFYDLVYHPEETVFLRHGRLTGHRTMNGKAMIVHQAVIAFCQRICRTELQARGMDTPEAYQRILEIMYQAWE